MRQQQYHFCSAAFITTHYQDLMTVPHIFYIRHRTPDWSGSYLRAMVKHNICGTTIRPGGSSAPAELHALEEFALLPQLVMKLRIS